MKYLNLSDLKVYQLSCEYCQKSWKIYERLNWQVKKIVGDQFITSVDSVGANISEGFGRFYFLDKIKFYYNARGSLLESKHWLDRMYERQIINQTEYLELIELYNNIKPTLNGLINSTRQTKNDQ